MTCYFSAIYSTQLYHVGTVGGAMVASQYSMKGGVYGRIATVRLSSRGVEV